MDTDVLRWFQRVADGVTVTEVSELDGVTQSGVSRALARLESEVGTPLLRRSGRTLRLTRAGEVFKPHVDSMLRRFDDGIAAVGQFVSPETGTVALAFQQSLGTWLVPDLVRSFRARHPRRPVPTHTGQGRTARAAARRRHRRPRDRDPPVPHQPGGHASGRPRGADRADRHRAAAARPPPRSSTQRAAAHPPEGRGEGAVHRAAVDLGAAEAGRTTCASRRGSARRSCSRATT